MTPEKICDSRPLGPLHERSKSAFAGLEVKPGWYSDLLLMYGPRTAVVRLALHPLAYWILTTGQSNHWERARRGGPYRPRPRSRRGGPARAHARVRAASAVDRTLRNGFTKLRLPNDTEVEFERLAQARYDGKPGRAASRRIQGEPERQPGLGTKIANATGNLLARHDHRRHRAGRRPQRRQAALARRDREAVTGSRLPVTDRRRPS
jgi:hypothetical protein